MKLLLLLLLCVPAFASDTWYNLVLPNTITAITGTAVPPQTSQFGGSDGTNLRALKVDSSGRPQINLDQIGGVSPSMGNGVSGSGVQRVALVTDQATPTRTTYTVSVANLAVAASATDIFTLTGSGTKTVKIYRTGISGTSTGGSLNNLILLRRSTANSGGTSSAATVVPSDSTNASGTATSLSYTANPTLGTLVGNMLSVKVPWPAPGGNTQSESIYYFDNFYSQPIVLRGTSESVAWNLGGVSVGGGSFSGWFVFSEE